jgi:peroxiredoxin-like protein
MSIVKAFRFPVSVHWQGGRITRASAFDKPDLRIAVPPEFRGGVPGVWSPEELLVSATASCFAVTLAGVAERMQLPLLRLEISGTGHVSKRDDGRFGFVAIELDVDVETPTVDAAERVDEAAAIAEERCIVSMALDVPVHVAVEAYAAAELVSERRAS